MQCNDSVVLSWFGDCGLVTVRPSLQLCNKEFQYAASLRAHLARHKRQKSQRAVGARAIPEDEDAADSKAKSRTKREFVCDICGKTLPKLYSLRIHMLNHTGVRPHCCRVCGKAFAHKHSLKMHRALHDALKQFHCSLCEKSFVSKRSLEEHTSIHTGEPAAPSRARQSATSIAHTRTIHPHIPT